jgi:hypothetical protein
MKFLNWKPNLEVLEDRLAPSGGDIIPTETLSLNLRAVQPGRDALVNQDFHFVRVDTGNMVDGTGRGILHAGTGIGSIWMDLGHPQVVYVGGSTRIAAGLVGSAEY